jgi:hypothetical protein
MKAVKQLPDGRWVDAETNKDLSDLIKAYEAFGKHRKAGLVGGAVKSDAKARAARRNGKLGGRPRKKIA